MDKRFLNTLLTLAVLWTIVTIVILCSGCNIAEYSVSNVRGWNLSACVSGFDTCRELYEDNESKFDNGFVSGMNNLPGAAE